MNNKKLTRREKLIIKLSTRIRDKKYKSLLAYTVYGSIAILFGILLLLIFTNSWINKDFRIEKNKIVEIRGTIAKKIKTTHNRSTINSMEIILNEYSNIKFIVDRFGAYAGYTKYFESQAKAGDSLYLDVLKEELSKENLNKTIEVSVYGIRDNKIDYLTFTDYNRALKDDKNPFVFFFLFVLCFLGIASGIYMLKEAVYLYKNFTT